jgi:dihydroxyacetone kinase
VGDGDCGTTLEYAASAIRRDLDAKYPLNGPVGPVVASIGRSVRSAVGGTSGALYDVAFQAAAASLVSGMKRK